MSIRAFLAQYIGSNLRICDKLEREVAAITTEDGREWVPVVRCRDCLHFDIYGNTFGWCAFHDIDCSERRYCAWGEREGAES